MADEGKTMGAEKALKVEGKETAPFTKVLSDINKGRVAAECNAELSAVVKAVQATGNSGEIVL